MLTVTDNAATEIRNLIDNPDVPDEGGVRIASDDEGALTLELTAGPADGDAVVDNAGARVFVEPQVSEVLEDKVLDAGAGPDGSLQFAIAEQA